MWILDRKRIEAYINNLPPKWQRVITITSASFLIILAIACFAMILVSNYLNKKDIIGTWQCEEKMITAQVDYKMQFQGFTQHEISFLDLNAAKKIMIWRFRRNNTFFYGCDHDATVANLTGFYEEVFSALYDNRQELTSDRGDKIAGMTTTEFQNYYAETFGAATFPDLIESLAADLASLRSLTQSDIEGTYHAAGVSEHQRHGQEEDYKCIETYYNSQRTDLFYLITDEGLYILLDGVYTRAPK